MHIYPSNRYDRSQPGRGRMGPTWNWHSIRPVFFDIPSFQLQSAPGQVQSLPTATFSSAACLSWLFWMRKATYKTASKPHQPGFLQDWPPLQFILLPFQPFQRPSKQEWDWPCSDAADQRAAMASYRRSIRRLLPPPCTNVYGIWRRYYLLSGRVTARSQRLGAATGATWAYISCSLRSVQPSPVTITNLWVPSMASMSGSLITELGWRQVGRPFSPESLPWYGPIWQHMPSSYECTRERPGISFI